MPALPNTSMERAWDGIIAGVDEAGRGPLAGPVVAAAVILDLRRLPRGLRDSKQMTRPQREAAFDVIHRHAAVGVGITSVEEIDAINILQASLLAMQRAVATLPVMPSGALVDGNQPPNLACPVRCVVEGDTLSLSIAAASIIAKVTRDRLMCSLALQHPSYGWEHNAGYGTSQHLQALHALGPTVHHRTSFKPVRHVLALRTKVA